MTIERILVYQTLLQTRLLPLFFSADIETSQKVAKACADGGAKLLEFTNRGEGALEVFKGLKAYLQKKQIPLILGAGSIIDAPTAALFVANGADFIVGPSHEVEISRFCNRRKIAYIPGCQTIKEISLAEEYGAEVVKVFPGSCIGGPEFITSVLGPMPWSKLLPTGGVEPEKESIQSWLKAGAAAVGMGSKLVRKDWIRNNQYQKIEELVASVIGWITELD